MRELIPLIICESGIFLSNSQQERDKVYSHNVKLVRVCSPVFSLFVSAHSRHVDLSKKEKRRCNNINDGSIPLDGFTI